MEFQEKNAFVIYWPLCFAGQTTQIHLLYSRLRNKHRATLINSWKILKEKKNQKWPQCLNWCKKVLKSWVAFLPKNGNHNICWSSCFIKFLKLNQVNLILAGFIHLKPQCVGGAHVGLLKRSCKVPKATMALLVVLLLRTAHKGVDSPERFTNLPWVNVINFELNGFNAFLWVPWSLSESKKL